MVVAEVLTGIALIKSSVDFIKQNIDTAKDIGSIASAVDNLFRGQDEINKARNKKSGVSLGDQFGVKSIAQETIDAKLAEEKMYEMKVLIDMRFGHGTWQSIIDERAKRIREAKEAEAEARRKKIQEAREFEETMKSFLTVGGVILLAFALFVGLFVFVL